MKTLQYFYLYVWWDMIRLWVQRRSKCQMQFTIGILNNDNGDNSVSYCTLTLFRWVENSVALFEIGIFLRIPIVDVRRNLSSVVGILIQVGLDPPLHHFQEPHSNSAWNS